MLEPLFFTQSFGWYSSKERNYSRLYMLPSSILMEVASADYYLSMQENIRHYILPHPVFSHHQYSLTQFSRNGSNRKHYMLSLHWEYIDDKLEKIQGILWTFMLEHLFFIQSFGQYGNKEGDNSRHFVLDFTLFMAVPSQDYYLSIDNKQQKLYVSSSYFLHQ